MRAVYYEAISGRILATVQATEANIKASGMPFLRADDADDNYAVTHQVIGGKLVEKADG